MDINVSTAQTFTNSNVDLESGVTIENKCILTSQVGSVSTLKETDCHESHRAQKVTDAELDTIPQRCLNNDKCNFDKSKCEMDVTFNASNSNLGNVEEDDDDMEATEEAEYDIATGNTNNSSGGSHLNASPSSIQNMSHHSFDDIQFFPSNRSLRLQPQFQFHHDQFNDPNFMGSNLSCFDASGLVNLSGGSGSVSGNFSLIGDSCSGDINSVFSESSFVFPDNVMEYGEPQFFPGNCVGYLETILEENEEHDEEYEEEEGCSGRHWWTADSDTDTESVIRVDNNQSQHGAQSLSVGASNARTCKVPGEQKDDTHTKPHFLSSASSKPFELEDLHLFDQLDHAFEETLCDPKSRAEQKAVGHQNQSQSVEQPVGPNKGMKRSVVENETETAATASAVGVSATPSTGDNKGKTPAGEKENVSIDSTNNTDNESRNELARKEGIKTLTQENVKAHSEENKIIYDVGEEKEQSSKKLGNAESRETFGSSLSPSSSDSETPAEVAEEDFFYSSPGSEEEECRSQEETESEESCSSDDSEKKGVVLAEFEFSLGSSAGGGNGGFNSSSGSLFGSGRSRRSFESPSRLKSFRSFDSLNCLAGTELLFSKPDTFPSIHHIKEVSEPSSESDEVSAADDRGIIPEEDEEEEEGENERSTTQPNQENNISGSGTDSGTTEPREETQSLPSQSVTDGFPGPSLLNHQTRNKNSVSSSNSTVSSSTSGCGLRSTENLSEDSGIGNDGVSSTAASTPGAFLEDCSSSSSNNLTKQQQNGDSDNTPHPPTNCNNSDTSSLMPDCAKDYISRAEFALNPFVYSSLSSSEPDSSMYSASSLNGSLSLSKNVDKLSLRENGKGDHSEESEGTPSKNSHDSRLGLSHCKSNDDLVQVNGINGHSTTNENSSSDGKKERPTPPTSSSETSSPSMILSNRHAADDDVFDDVSGTPDTSSLSESSSSAHAHVRVPNFSRTNDTTLLESCAAAPTKPNTKICDDKMTLYKVDERQDKDKHEVLSNNYASSSEGHIKPATTRKSDNNALVPAEGDVPIQATQMMDSALGNKTAIRRNSKDQQDNLHNEDEDEDMISSSSDTVTTIKTSCLASPTEQEPPAASDSKESMANSTRMTNSQKEENEESVKLSSTSFVKDADSSKKEFSIPATARSQDFHSQEHSSSSSGDEQANENGSESQPKFQRQRSDSESEYEAAESAMERNNIDMAYDIIVNSPIKKVQSQVSSSSSPSPCISTVSGVGGATTITDSPSPSSSSSAASSSSSFVHADTKKSMAKCTSAQYQYQSQPRTSENEASANKCRESNKKCGPVSTLSSELVNVHRNDSLPSGIKSGLCRNGNDNRLPVFESSIDDYDDETLALPIAANENMQQATNISCNSNNHVVLGGAHTQNKFYSHCTTVHSQRQSRQEKDANVTHVVNRIESQTSSLPLEHSNNHRVIENTSFLLHHHQLQQPHQPHSNNNTEQNKNSDELTLDDHAQVVAVAQPRSQIRVHVATSAGSSPCYSSVGDGVGDQHREFIDVDEEEQRKKRKNFSTHHNNNHNYNHDVVGVEAQKQKHQRIIHQDQLQRNSHVLGSVTLDDSTSADVAHNNLQHNPTQNALLASISHPASNLAPSNNDPSHFTITPTDTSQQSLYKNSCSHPDNKIGHHENESREVLTLTKSSNNKGYHHHPDSSDKLVIAEPYYPNQIGVAEVKKFLAGYVAAHLDEFSGAGASETPQSSYGNNNNNNKHGNISTQEPASAVQYYESQSVKNPIFQGTASVNNIGSSSFSGGNGPDASIAATLRGNVATATAVDETTGREKRVILGDSNFGFFGCSSHSRASSTSRSYSEAETQQLHESHECFVSPYNDKRSKAPSSDILFPQVNLDLHSISAAANESGFSPGYGFPSSSSTTLPSAAPQEEHSLEQDTWPEQQLLPLNKENNTFSPSHIKRSSFSPSSGKAAASAHPLSKGLNKAEVTRRDHPQHSKDNQQQQQRHHLHLEDINLYAGLDKFSVPLGAIKAAVVAVAPSIPSYIVGSTPSSSAKKSNAPSTSEHKITTAEKNSNKTRNSEISSAPRDANEALAVHGNNNHNNSGNIPLAPAAEANGNLSSVFPQGTANAFTANNGININSSSSALPKGGENNDHQQQQAHANATTVPDILILKQFSSCMSSDFETTEVEHKNLVGNNNNGNRGNITSRIIPTQLSDPGGSERQSVVGDINISGAGATGKNNTRGDNNTSSKIDSSSSVDMLRSDCDSPTGSSAATVSAPSGIPLKTKTYGPRNEVEVVVVSSRTPSPAPGAFHLSTGATSASSSRNLPSTSTPSSSSVGHEPAHATPTIGTGCTSSSSSNVTTTADYHYERCASRESSRSSSIPPPPTTSPSPTTATAKANKSRVHFSPIVSEISWRESYIDQSSECSGSNEDLLAKIGFDNNGASANFMGDSYSGLISSSGDNYNQIRSGVCDSANNNANIDVGGSSVRPLQVYDIQMSTSRQESPSARESGPSGKVPVLVEKVEMTSSPLHDHETPQERSAAERPLLFLGGGGGGDSHSSRKLMRDDENNDDPERVTDLVDFRSSGGANNKGGTNYAGNGDHNGTLGVYEDVQVEITPTSKSSQHGSTTLSMVPDLLSQCESTSGTLTHIDVKIEEGVPNLHTKNIVLNIGPPSQENDNAYQRQKREHQQQQQKPRGKSQSPQPHTHEVIQSSSHEQRQIFPKMFAEDGKNDSKRNSSNLSSSSKAKNKSSKGFLIQGLGSSGKKSERDGNGAHSTSTVTTTTPVASSSNINGDNNKSVATSTFDALATKENKKTSKPGFFERLSKIRLSSGSKNKKQKVHPKAEELHQEADVPSGSSLANTASANIGPNNRPLRSANSVNVNSGATASSKTNNHNSNSGAAHTSPGNVQPILKKPTVSGSTLPGSGQYHNGKDNNVAVIGGESENEPDANQAFENILEEIAGLKSIQLRQEKSSNSSIDKSPTREQVRSFAKRKQFYNNASSPSPPPTSPSNSRSYSELDTKLTQFKEDTSRTLDAISKSHPDLEIIEGAVNKQRQQRSLSPEPNVIENIESVKRPGANTLPNMKSPSYAATEAAQNSEREWYRLMKSAAEKFSYNKGPTHDHHFYFEDNAPQSHKTGIVETDLDTGASREMLDEDMLQLDCKVPCYTVSTSEIPTSATAANMSVSIATSTGSPATVKARSLTNLSVTRLPLSIAPSQFEDSTGDLSDSEERAKSLEFLLDDNHKSSSEPPENKLRQETRQLSEHELRIQRSLQRLNVPEWYKQHGASGSSNAGDASQPDNKCGTLSIFDRSKYGSSGGLAGGWSGLSAYKAPSMSSLQSNGGRNSGTLPNKSNFVRGRPATMSVTARTSKESLMASGSTSHSPSAFERSSFTYGMPFTMTRFGQGRLSTHSSSVSPPSTPDSTAVAASYVKKPYLGWRSQEKLNAAAAGTPGTPTTPGATTAPKLSIYLPPAERLAADLLASRSKPPQHPHPPVRPPVCDRPPLPKAPPRSEKTVLTKNQNQATGTMDEPKQTPGAKSSSSRAISKQTSSLAVVTKLPQNSNSIPPPDFSQNGMQSFQSQHQNNKLQSTKAAAAPDVHDSIRQVTTAISHYVNRGQESQPQQKPKPRTGKKQAIWIESSFVGQKPPSN